MKDKRLKNVPKRRITSVGVPGEKNEKEQLWEVL